MVQECGQVRGREVVVVECGAEQHVYREADADAQAAVSVVQELARRRRALEDRHGERRVECRKHVENLSDRLEARAEFETDAAHQVRFERTVAHSSWNLAQIVP